MELNYTKNIHTLFSFLTSWSGLGYFDTCRSLLSDNVAMEILLDCKLVLAVSLVTVYNYNNYKMTYNIIWLACGKP